MTYRTFDGTSQTETIVDGRFSSDGTQFLKDNENVNIGTGEDLKIYHSGSHSYIQDEGEGNLYIDSNQLYLRNADTDNVLLQTTSAGATKIKYNGSETAVIETTSTGISVTGVGTFSGALEAQRLSLVDDGASSPLLHIQGDDGGPWALCIGNSTYSTNASHGFHIYQANAGNVVISNIGKQENDHNEIKFRQSDGITVKDVLILGTDQSATFAGDITVSNTKPTITLNDTNSESDYIVQNDDGVFAITDIDNNVGRLTIASNGQTTISGNCDFSNGIDVTGDATFTGDVSLPDDKKLQFGDTSTPDLEIYHDPSNSLIETKTGNLIIKDTTADPYGVYIQSDLISFQSQSTSSNEQLAKFEEGGAVKLYFDGGDPKFETNSSGTKTWGGHIMTNGGTLTGGDLSFADNSKAKFGDDHDLQVFHNDTRAKIQNNTGELRICSDVIELKNYDDDTNYLSFASGGNATFSGGSDAKVTIYAPTHDSGSTQQVQLEFKYNQSHANDSVGYIKLVEGSTNHYGGYLSFGVPYDNSGTPATRDDVLKLNHDGNAEFAGELKIANGNGIDFSAVSGSAAGASSSKLDDYEEGTWTPTFTAAGGGSDQWQTKEGTYTKIGNMVTARFMCRNYNNAGTASLSGDITCSGLPFDNAVHFYVGDFGFFNMNLPTGATGGAMIFLAASSDTWQLHWDKDNDNSIVFNTADLKVGSYFQGNLTYRVA